MAEIINLRRARKSRARQTQDNEATVRRAAFGRTKAELALDAAEHLLEKRRLDAHRRDAQAASGDDAKS